MKTRNLLRLVVVFFFLGNNVAAVAQSGEFSISGDCYNSILGGIAFDGQNFVAGMTGDLDGNTNVTVQFISPGGQLSGNRVGMGETGSAPVIAFDGTNYLIIWADRYVGFLDNGEDAGMTNIYGRFMNPSGEFIASKFIIASDAYIKGSTPGAVHFNGTNYFFIYREDDGNNDEGHEYGVFISIEGEVSENPIQITSTDVQDIALAFDGTNYLTVFNVDSRYIYGQFISKAGALVGTAFLIDNSENYSDDPISLAFGNNKYLVTFPDDNNPGLNDNPEWNIFGRFVSMSGEVDADKIPVCDYTQNPIFPTVAFDGTKFLTAWISMNDQKIKGRIINFEGVAEGEEYVIFDKTTGTMPLGGVSLFSGNKFLAVCTRVDWETSQNSMMAQNVNQKSASEALNNGIYGKFLGQITAAGEITEAKDLLNIFPNPASGSIKLNLHEIKNAWLNMYKITGELISSERIVDPNQQFYIGNLPDGTYVVEIKNSNRSEKQKILIQN